MSKFEEKDFGLVRVGRKRKGIILNHTKIRGER
jgi:hypothetical protein